MFCELRSCLTHPLLRSDNNWSSPFRLTIRLRSIAKTTVWAPATVLRSSRPVTNRGQAQRTRSPMSKRPVCGRTGPYLTPSATILRHCIASACDRGGFPGRPLRGTTAVLALIRRPREWNPFPNGTVSDSQLRVKGPILVSYKVITVGRPASEPSVGRRSLLVDKI